MKRKQLEYDLHVIIIAKPENMQCLQQCLPYSVAHA